MRRIVDRHDLTDLTGNVWRVWTSVPDEALVAHGPDEPTVEFLTPNDPEHYAYGEDGPTFLLADLAHLLDALTES